jgi:hypothetical protein
MEFLKKITEFVFGKQIIVEHSFFGKMIDAGDYYECRRMFRPTGTMVEIGLSKTAIEGDKKQVEFFHWLEDNFDLVIEKITPTLLTKLNTWIPNFRIYDFKKEFILEYLRIPSCEQTVFEWEISFYANNEIQHSCHFTMEGLSVKNLHIDG